MRECGGWRHDDVAVAIGFNPSLDPGELAAQCGIGQQFSPATQVEFRLIAARWKLDRQGGHAHIVARKARVRDTFLPASNCNALDLFAIRGPATAAVGFREVRQLALVFGARVFQSGSVQREDADSRDVRDVRD